MHKVLGLILAASVASPALSARGEPPGASRFAFADEPGHAQFARELSKLKLATAQLERAMPILLQPGERLHKASSPHFFLSHSERAELLDSWRQVLQATEQLDSISRHNLAGLATGPLCNEDLCFERAVLGGVARLAKLIHGTVLLTAVRRAPKLRVLLDEARPELGIPAGSLQRFRSQVMDEFELGRLLAFARSGSPRVSSFYAGAGDRALDTDRWLLRFWVRHREVLDRALLGTDASGNWFSGSVSVPASELLFATADSLIKPIAIFLGRTKVLRPGQYLISRPQMVAMASQLEPGDVLLEKTQGYLCNLFIEGYWGHSILHIGRYEQALAAFDTAELRAAFRERGFADFESYLQAQVPAAAAAWRDGKGVDGAPVRFIEGDGIAKEVVLSSIGQAMDADSLAALRPRLDPLDKALAIVDALGYWQRAYDYAFDVRSDSELVCTELLVKAYASDVGKRGLRMPVRRIGGGRFMIYPSDISALFERERERDDRQFDFVYLLRADEANERSVVADEQSFLGSHRWISLL